MPTLTPSAMLFGQPNQIPEDDADTVDDVDLKKRARYLQRCIVDQMDLGVRQVPKRASQPQPQNERNGDEVRRRNFNQGR